MTIAGTGQLTRLPRLAGRKLLDPGRDRQAACGGRRLHRRIGQETPIAAPQCQHQRSGCLAAFAAGSWVIPSLRLGEAVGEFSEGRGADQIVRDGVTARRQCPVIAGGTAAPDPPSGVVAPEPLKFAPLIVPAVAGVHGAGTLTGGVMNCLLHSALCDPVGPTPARGRAAPARRPGHAAAPRAAGCGGGSDLAPPAAAAPRAASRAGGPGGPRCGHPAKPPARPGAAPRRGAGPLERLNDGHTGPVTTTRLAWARQPLDDTPAVGRNHCCDQSWSAGGLAPSLRCCRWCLITDRSASHLLRATPRQGPAGQHVFRKPGRNQPAADMRASPTGPLNATTSAVTPVSILHKADQERTRLASSHVP